jgi:hypothetical protein
VFEDLEYLKKSIYKYESVREIWFNGRYAKTYAMCAFQYIMEIPMALRGMFDYAVFAMENNAAARERIYKQYCGIIPTYGAFETIFKECTADHKVMVVDCRSVSYNLQDTIFWYKAKDRGFFHMGVEDIWNPKVDIQNLKKEGKKKKPIVTLPPKVRKGDNAWAVKLIGEKKK